MTDDATRVLLDRFLGAVRPSLPLVALWAHGSLGGGDYQPGRSDLDLIAVVARPCTAEEERAVEDAHERLERDMPLAAKLHCSYVAVPEAADPGQDHLTWAHQELFRRPVTPVTRRELHEFGLVIHGLTPASVLPPVTDEELKGFVAGDLAGYWRPSLEFPEEYQEDIWIDLSLLTLARATVTLREGRLITKREALDVLTRLGAPAEVVDDIRRRRYETPTPAPASPEWRTRRAALTLDYLAPAIDRTVSAHDSRRGRPQHER
ncbi:nucleotidyltransferase [Sphaerisporangium rhizosphaerae]|uniref:Nucleotidyltransferase n=1 Tax=Sphaerisporangium rhizosphaerae TaxID=2269375 RepID=A0ABW2PA69_9ACTN